MMGFAPRCLGKGTPIPSPPPPFPLTLKVPTLTGPQWTRGLGDRPNTHTPSQAPDTAFPNDGVDRGPCCPHPAPRRSRGKSTVPRWARW